MKRRLEYVDSKSQKFWEVEVSDTNVLITYGKIETEGRQQEKSFASKEDADKFALKKINEKLKKGYTEISTKTSTTDKKSNVQNDKPIDPIQKEKSNVDSTKNFEIIAKVGQGAPFFLDNGNLLLISQNWDTRQLNLKELDSQSNFKEPINLGVIKGFRDTPISRALNSKGDKILCGYKSHKLCAWPSTKNLIQSIKGPRYNSNPNSLSFSPDGKLFAIADGGYITPSDRWIRIYETETGKEVNKLKSDGWVYEYLEFSDNQTIITYSLELDCETPMEKRLIACWDIKKNTQNWVYKSEVINVPFIDSKGEHIFVLYNDRNHILKISIEKGEMVDHIKLQHPVSHLCGVINNHFIVSIKDSIFLIHNGKMELLMHNCPTGLRAMAKHEKSNIIAIQQRDAKDESDVYIIKIGNE
jgi:predicted DNA-binding WGR domain protein